MTDVNKQIRLLESQDTKVAGDARQALSIQLNLGCGIADLVKYYAEQRSERALDLLCSIKEEHSKALLDMLGATLRPHKTQEVIILLGQIVQQAPSWTPRIAHHPLFKVICDFIKKGNVEVLDIISGILFISLLLPHCTALSPNSHLNWLFHAFIGAADVYRRKLRDVERTKLEAHHVDRANNLHLGFAIREFFQVLYGIYPTNFLTFLRTYLSNQPPWDKSSKPADKYKIIPCVIYPLFYGVRLHPNLVLVSATKELSKDRWNHREAHDFLDEIRKMSIGAMHIPIVGDLEDGCRLPPDSPDGFDKSAFSELIMQSEESSSTTHVSRLKDDEGGEGDVGVEVYTEVEEGGDPELMELLNTPPGSVVGEPKPKQSTTTVDEQQTNVVLITPEEPRRSTSTGSRFRISSIFKRNEEKAQPPPQPVPDPIEIVSAEEDGAEMDEAEEGEEALNCCTPRAKRQGEYSATSTPSTEREAPMTSPSEPPRLSGDDEMKRKMAKILQDREAAVKAVHNRTANVDQDDASIVRERSASSFLGNTNGSEERERTSTMDTNNGADITENSDNGLANESMDGGRSRFSVTSYFTRLNRQRFVSECPAIEPEHLGELVASKQKRQGSKSLERTNSCPNIVENTAKLPSIGNLRSPTEAAKPPSSQEWTSQFPYLKLVQPVTTKYFDMIEERLEEHHENNRKTYMVASSGFHNCLKELGLADRLPGKIYDDMSHITSGLPIDKQRDVLRTRLQLVNQHLLYERSCRLLHANRNRKLFAKLKQQKISENELSTTKQKLHQANIEKENLRKHFSVLRGELANQKVKFCNEEEKFKEKVDKFEDDIYEVGRLLAESEEKARSADRRYKILINQVDSYRRRAEDAENEKFLLENKLKEFQMKDQELKKVLTENQLLRDQNEISENRRDEDRLKNGDVEERIFRLQSELERLRKEKEQERIQKEEYREKVKENEHNYKLECQKNDKLKMYLERASKLLIEQNEAAEQKFLSLQAITQKQEEHITNLYGKIEDLGRHTTRAFASPVTIPDSNIPPEIRSYAYSASEPSHSYFIQDNVPPPPPPPPPVPRACSPAPALTVGSGDSYEERDIH